MKSADSELLSRARVACRRAYAPYSEFHVGAGVRTASGAIFEGANFENGSYGATICAERAAVGHAISHEGRRDRKLVIVRIAVVVESVARAGQVASAPPCGICRQVLAEFAPEATVEFRSGGRLISMTVSE